MLHNVLHINCLSHPGSTFIDFPSIFLKINLQKYLAEYDTNLVIFTMSPEMNVSGCDICGFFTRNCVKSGYGKKIDPLSTMRTDFTGCFTKVRFY